MLSPKAVFIPWGPLLLCTFLFPSPVVLSFSPPVSVLLGFIALCFSSSVASGLLFTPLFSCTVTPPRASYESHPICSLL